MAEDDPQDPTLVTSIEIVKIREKHKTLRLGLCLTAGVVGFGILAWVVVRLTDKPWWEAVAHLIVTLAVLYGPAHVMRRSEKKFRNYMETDHQRVREIEESVDPDRTSSGLNTDGSPNHGL